MGVAYSVDYPITRWWAELHTNISFLSIKNVERYNNIPLYHFENIKRMLHFIFF